MSGDLPKEPVAFVGCRVSDPDRVVISGSTFIPCECCKESVSLSPASIRRLRICDTVICVECSAEIAKKRGTKWREIQRNTEQIHELKVLKSRDN